MKIPIEAWNTPQLWRLPGATAELRIYASIDFVTSDNQLWPGGRISDPTSYYLAVPCTIIGNVLLIPDFELDSTVDALVNPHVTYTAVLVATNGKKALFISNFALNTLEAGDPSMQWAEILLFRDMPQPRQSEPSLLRQIAAMIQVAAGNLLKASNITIGGTFLTVAPLDPTAPIAVGANDPGWLDWLAGVGRVADSGEENIDGANLPLTIAAPEVTADSKIALSSHSPDVIGTLYYDNIIPGVSFDVYTTNPGDFGPISWIMTG